MFLQACVILFTGVGEYLGRYPPPPDQVHPSGPGTPPWRVPPPDQVPPGPGTPPGRYTPLAGTHPPRGSACWEIRATSERYASYWNAFLLIPLF